MMRFTGLLAAAAFAAVTAACSQTDSGMTTKIKAEMAQDDLVEANDINVTTRDHVVTLTGTVETPAEKEQALRIARAADGVTDVVDEIRVTESAATSGARERDGENIFEKAADATVDGAKKVGSTVKEAVTDDDPDSNNDGK